MPQFILKNWAFENLIWTLNKKENQIIRPNIENICAKNFLYDVKSPLGGIITANEYEKRFAEYEGKIANFHRELINMLDINNCDALVLRKKERKILLEFAISIATRSPRMISYFVNKKGITKEMPELLEEFYIFVNNFTNLFGIKISKEQCEEMLNKTEILCSISPEDEENITLGLFNKFVSKDFEKAFFYILKNENEIFFANDMFSVLLETEFDKQIYMPLSPKYCFICSINQINEWNKNKINLVDDDYCYQVINNISSECNFIFSNSKENLEKLKNCK